MPRACNPLTASLLLASMQASVRCLGNWGKLLEIGKYDILKGTPLSMRPMLNNISFEGIDVDRVMNHSDSTEVLPQPKPLPCTTRSFVFAALCIKGLSWSLQTSGASSCFAYCSWLS